MIKFQMPVIFSRGNAAQKIAVPSQEFFNAAAQLSKYTPDMWRFGRVKSFLLFVPDEIMRGHSMNGLISGVSEFRGKAFTAEADYIMWKKDVGIESMAVPMQGPWQKHYLRNFKINGGPMYPLSRIQGELYKITVPEFVTKIDGYKQNTKEFNRQRVDLLLPYRIQEGKQYSTEMFLQPVHAWMYLGIPKYWSDFIESPHFKPIHYITPNNPCLGKLRMDHYYFFSRMLCVEDENVGAPYLGKKVEEPKIEKTEDVTIVNNNYMFPPRELERISVTRDVVGVEDNSAAPIMSEVPVK